ncbi:MAG TPA: HYR domain-containing protein [Candidatus Bathyarchaeia archaeon]|nr:HYR domain-containing protein [Candidatus Bathyarchaeia archaeon]
MPTTVGNDYMFTIVWDRTPSAGLTSLTAMTFQVDVVPNTPPHLVLPTDETVEATSPAGAAATYSATATDAEDTTAPTPTCTPASGSTFPLGTTTVNCTVADSGGMTDSGSFHVNVVDTTAPKIVGTPANINLMTNNASGTTLTYTPPTATDAADPSPSVGCAPASGSAIPVGLTTVTCTATDASGNHSSTTFDANVALNTAPHLSLPSDKIVEATSSAGAVASFTATATDAEDASAPTPSCSPSSGSTFALGTTTVNCSVTDTGGLSDSGTFKVTVVDSTAPSLVGMPSDLGLTTNDPTGSTLTYTPPTATDVVDPSPSVSCTPASGSKVPVGTTTVTCTATDAAGNHSSANFHATVGFVSSVAWSAVWGEPVGVGVDSFVANAGRTLPIKVQVFANGVERTTGRVDLAVATCSGGAVWSGPLAWDGSRWTGHLDTSWLSGPGCYRVSVALDGNAAGSFRLDLRGSVPAAPAKPATTKPKG